MASVWRGVVREAARGGAARSGRPASTRLAGGALCGPGGPLEGPGPFGCLGGPLGWGSSGRGALEVSGGSPGSQLEVLGSPLGFLLGPVGVHRGLPRGVLWVSWRPLGISGQGVLGGRRGWGGSGNLGVGHSVFRASSRSLSVFLLRPVLPRGRLARGSRSPPTHTHTHIAAASRVFFCVSVLPRGRLARGFSHSAPLSPAAASVCFVFCVPCLPPLPPSARVWLCSVPPPVAA